MNVSPTPSTSWLAIPEAHHREAWQQSQAVPVAGSRLQSYINQVCWQTLRPWLHDMSGVEPRLAPNFTDPTLWALVTGVGVQLGDTRLVIVPSEAMDGRELRVPQEWMEIPEWVADYYVAVEVDTDGQQLHVWGYATQADLRAASLFDGGDRTYVLDGDDVIRDLTVFWVAYALANEPEAGAIAPLPSLPAAAAERLIAQLTPSVLPRLAVPFAQWGALMQHEPWRQALCHQRRSASPQASALTPLPTRLRQWFTSLTEAGWEPIESLLTAQPDLAFSLRRDEGEEAPTRRVKRISVRDDLEPLLLILMLTPASRGRVSVRVRMFPPVGMTYLPPNLTLELRSLTNDVLQSVQARSQDNSIQLKRFWCPVGMQFQICVALEEILITEEFIA